MLVATALNMFTTKKRTDTVVCLQASRAEAFLHNAAEGPDAMRIRLSPVFGILRRQAAEPQAQRIQDEPVKSENSVIDQLTKLGQLLEKGLITQEEFARLKADLLP